MKQLSDEEQRLVGSIDPAPMLDRAQCWSAINTGTGNLAGLARQAEELADAFAVLPGGMGTLDETFEILTWKQLRLHAKPIVLVNQDGYWRKWLDLVAHVVNSGFAHPDTQRLYAVVEDVDRVLAVATAELESSRHGEPRRF